jgi:alpha-L-rhamnosidase
MTQSADKPKWIWIARRAHGEDSYLRARRSFTLGAVPASARLRITAFSEYVLYVNGRYVGCGPAPSGFEEPRLDVYTEADLPLVRGRNVIAVLAHNHCLSLPRRARATAGLWVELSLTGGRGGVQKVVTDRRWHVSAAEDFSPRAPRIHWSAGFTEVRDCRREPTGWTEARFSEARWSPADEVRPEGTDGAGPPRPRDRALPRLRETFVRPRTVVSAGRTAWSAGTTAIPFEFAVPNAAHGEFYAATFVHAQARRRARLVFDCDEAAAVYINNRQALRQSHREEYISCLDAGEQNDYTGLHRGQGLRAETAEIELAEGWNAVGVVLYDPADAWGFAMRLEDLRCGRPLELAFSPDQQRQQLADWHVVLDLICPCGNGQLPDTPAPNARTFPDPAYALAWEVQKAGRAAAGAATLLADAQGPGRLVLKDREYVVYDLGAEAIGFIEIETDAAPGAILDVAWAEGLDRDGRVEPVRGGLRQVDRLILGNRPQTVRFFNRRALRYLELVARTGGDTVTVRRVDVSALSRRADPPPVPETADRELAGALALAARTVHACVQDTLEGSPAREAEQSIPAAFLLSQAQRVLEGRPEMGEAALRVFAADQAGDGFFRAVVPAGTTHVVPDWNLLWIIWLADHVAWTGDRTLARELYPVAARALDWTASFRDEAGLLENRPDRAPWWLFVDLSPTDKRGVVTAWQALYVRALRAAAEVAEAAGDNEAASHDRAEAKAVAEAARRRLWDPARGLFVDARQFENPSPDASAATNYYALYGGLATDEQAGRILSALWEDDSTETADWGPYQNPFVKYFALEALLAGGRVERALALIRSYWGAMARRGLATVPEVYPVPEILPPVFHDGQPDGPFGRGPLPAVLCHGWGVHPAALVATWVLGVRPAGPGFEPILVAPMPGDLRKISGRVWTPQGPVEVRIGPDDRGRRVQITVPAGAAYRVDRRGLADVDELEITGGKAVK